jgi:hypothetical protein
MTNTYLKDLVRFINVFQIYPNMFWQVVALEGTYETLKMATTCWNMLG